MATGNRKVDEHLAKSALLAQPILRKLRDIIRAVGSELDEIVNWGVPGDKHHHLVFRAAFQLHVHFGFGKGALMSVPAGFFAEPAVGSMSRVIVPAVRDLPSKSALKSLVREAMRLNIEGAKRSFLRRPNQSLRGMPADLQAQVAASKKRCSGVSSIQRLPWPRNIK